MRLKLTWVNWVTSIYSLAAFLFYSINYLFIKDGLVTEPTRTTWIKYLLFPLIVAFFVVMSKTIIDAIARKNGSAITWVLFLIAALLSILLVYINPKSLLSYFYLTNYTTYSMLIFLFFTSIPVLLIIGLVKEMKNSKVTIKPKDVEMLSPILFNVCALTIAILIIGINMLVIVESNVIPIIFLFIIGYSFVFVCLLIPFSVIGLISQIVSLKSSDVIKAKVFRIFVYFTSVSYFCFCLFIYLKTDNSHTVRVLFLLACLAAVSLLIVGIENMRISQTPLQSANKELGIDRKTQNT